MASNRIATIFLVIFLIAHAKADICSAGCDGATQPKGGFLEGNTYTYSLDGVASINLSGADNQETKVKLNAQVNVYGLGNCANFLKVTALTITGQDGTKYPKPSDIEHPVRFTLQDGVLGSDICVESGDSQKSINIKRAIISLLQAATENSQEVDVFGICPTAFQVSKEGGGLIVHKTRDLNECAHREQGKQDLLTYVYNDDSAIKNSNILKSSMRSDSAVKNGIVEKVEVQEDYLYRPFSVGQHGVKGNVNTKLVLKGTTKGTLTANCVTPKSIIFENPHPVNTDHSNVINIMNSLKTATDSMKDHVQENSASKFVTLVRAMRVSSKDDLKTVYGQIQSGSQIKDNHVAKKVFLDALFRTGTGDSVEFSIALLQEKQLSSFEEKLVLASLSTVRHATSHSLKSAIVLLDNEKLPLDVYLGVGALAGAYCKEHTCHGAKSQDDGVLALSNKLAAKLGNCKSGSKKAENLKVAVLKGIRNIGHIEDCLIDKLAQCASDKSVKQRVRVAALEAFHADPCIGKLKQSAIKVMRDTNQDSEVRIKAYLALVDCPCEKVGEEVKKLMEHEPIYQVGSFISSSLRNILASTNPNKKLAKKHLGSLVPKLKKYPMNVAKYSRNYEVSYEMNSAGIGSSVEANVIFSQDSYLPRSANLNLTTEIFGRQINLFEFGVRQGNLDRVVEQYFGPRSALHTDTPQQLYSGFKKTVDSIIEKLNERSKKYKTKRDVQKQIAAIGKKLKTDIQGYSGNLDLDIVVKLFGVESVFLSLGDDHPASFEAIIDKIFNMIDTGVDKAKTFSHNVHTNLVFLDMELAYPTSTGLTMKLNLEGAMTSKLGLSGNLDINQILHDPKNSKIDLKVIPSANVEIIASLAYDADSVIHGLKTVMSLQTSTGSHMVLKTTDHGFDMQIGLPVEKQELLTASSNIFFYKREKGGQDIDNKCKFDRQNWLPFQTGCFDQFASTLGLTLCADMSIPKTWDGENKNKILEQPMFPLSGNALFSIRLEKESLNAYHIKGNHIHKDGLTTTDLDFFVEGPQRNNKFAMKLETLCSSKIHSALMKLDSSVIKLESYIGVKTSEEEYMFDAHIFHDDTKYIFKCGVMRPDSNTYKPVLDYQFGKSHDMPITVDGVVKVQKAGNGKKYTLSGVSLNMGHEKFLAEGYVSHAATPFLWDMDVKFTNQDKFLSVKNKLEKDSDHVKGFLEFQNSLNPNAGFRIDMQNTMKPKENNFDFSIIHGKDSQSTVNKIAFSSHCEGTANPPDYKWKSKLTYPLQSFSAKMESEVNSKTFDFEMEGEYQKKKAEFELALKRQMKKKGDLYAKLKSKVADKGIEIEGKFEEETEFKGNFFGKVDVKPQGKYEVSGTILHKFEPEDKEYGVVATYKQAGKSDDYKIDFGTSCTPSGFNHHTKLSRGAVSYVDITADMKRHPDNGNIKIMLKDSIDAHGQFKVNADKKGNAVFIIDFTKWDRKVKVESNFINSVPTHNLNVDFYPNAAKDANNKISFSTTNNIQDGHFDSKNALTVQGEKTEFNIKGEHNGIFENGNTKSDVEFKTHSGKALTFTFAREAVSQDSNVKGSMDFSSTYVPKAGASPFKAVWKARLINMDKKTKQVEAEHHLNFISDSGKDFDIKLGIKRTPKDDRTLLDIKGDISGSMCDHHSNVVMAFDYFDVPDNDDKEDMTYRIKGTYGDKGSMDLTGSLYSLAEDEKDGTFKNDFDLHVVFPSEKPYDFRFTSKDILVIPEDDEKYFEFTTSKAVQLNGRWHKYDGTIKIDEHAGNMKMSAAVPDHQKIVFDSNYKLDKLEDESCKYLHTMSLDYGENKHLKFVIDAHRNTDRDGQINFAVDLPEGSAAKKVVTNVNYKMPSQRAVSGDMKIDIDGKKYSLSSNINTVDPNDSTYEFKASYPDGKPAKAYIHAWRLADNQYKGESKFENLGDFSMDLNVDAKLVSAQVWNIKTYVNSEKLKLNKINFEAASENAKTNKIQFSATEDGKNVLSGTTAFQIREEGNKFIMEGSGNVKVKNDQKTTSFKYIRSKLKEETEKGYDIFFNVALGEKTIVVEHKQTNKEYKLSSVYCEEKKQCANLEIKNKLDTSAVRTIHHMDFSFDLRKLGFAPEFGLSTATELERFKMPVHTLNIHMSQDKFKYHVEIFAKPDSAKKSYLTAMTWTTPNRIVSLETTTGIPESTKTIFPIQHETVFFFNKNDPKTKNTFRISQDFKREEHKSVTSSGEILFSSPALGKDLQITGKSHYDVKTHQVTFDAVFDIFKKKTQKVVANMKFSPQIVKNKDFWKSKVSYDFDAHIDGKALGFLLAESQKFALSAEGLELNSRCSVTIDQQAKEVSLALGINKHEQNFVVKIPNKELINYQCHCHHGEKSHKMDSTLTLLGDKTYTINTEFIWSPNYKISVTEKAKDQPGELHIFADTHPMKSLELGVEYNDGKAKQNLVYFYADTKSAKPKWEFNNKNIKPVAEKITKSIKGVIESASKTLKEFNDDLNKNFNKVGEISKTAAPDFKQFLTTYKQELDKMSNELQADKNLANFADSIGKVFLSVNKVFVEITNKYLEIVGQTNEAIMETVQKLVDVWTSKILPAMTNLVEKVSQAFLTVAGAVLELVSTYVVRLSEFLDKHHADFKPIFDDIAKIMSDIWQGFEKNLSGLREQLVAFITSAKDQFAEFPLIQMLNEKLEEHDIPQAFLSFVSGFCNQLKSVSSTDEMRAFLDAINAYVEKKVLKKDCDDIEELSIIYKKAISAYDSLVSKEDLKLPQLAVPDYSFFSGWENKFPSLAPPQFSVVNHILFGNIPDPFELFKTYRLKSLVPTDWVPPYKLQAIVAGGQHIFTFDGRHLTFPGTCKYVLAQDAVDGNFSIVLNMEKGAAKSIVLWDKSGDEVEVNEHDLLVNGQKHGFPLIKSNIQAYRNGHYFELSSSYGVYLGCSNNLDLCYFEISGFYFAKLRGLLGDGNNEPYDDFRMPNGKISNAVGDFGTAYSLTNCAVPKVMDHAMHHGHEAKKLDGICKQVFGSESPLSHGKLRGLDTDNYIQACEHAVAKGDPHPKDEVCLIARAYQLACRKTAIFVSMPDICNQCHMDDKTLEPGESFTFKLPLKQADIVLAVETTKTNEKIFRELTMPLMSNLVDELKSKGINDVKVTLIGISPKFNRPLEYDVENAKLKGNKMTFTDENRSAPWQSPITLENEKQDKVLNDLTHTAQKILKELGLDNFHISYMKFASRMTWRPKAVKTYILFHSEPYVANPLLQLLNEIRARVLVTDIGATAHLFTPLENLKGKGAKENSIVGFSEKQVFLLGDKKRGAGHPDMRNSIEHKADTAVERTLHAHGNAYSTKTFSELNGGDRKNFISLAAQTIVDSMVEIEQDVLCRCRNDIFTMGHDVFCRTLNKKDKRTPGSKK